MKRRNPDTPSMDMGGAVAEAPNILQSPMEVLQDLIRMQDEGLNKQRVEKWLQLDHRLPIERKAEA